MSAKEGTATATRASKAGPSIDSLGTEKALNWLSRASSQEGYAEAVLEAALQTVHGAAGSIMLTGGEAEAHLRIVAARGPRQAHILGRTVAFGEPIAGQVAESRTLLHVTDVSLDPHLIGRTCQGRRGRRYAGKSFVSVPLLADERLVGVMNVSSHRNGQFSRENAAYLDNLSGAIAQCLAQLPPATAVQPVTTDTDGFGTILQFATQSDRTSILQILNLVDQAVVCFDEHSHIVWMNAAAETLFGRAESGRGLAELAVTLPTSDWRLYVEMGLANGEFDRMEEVLVASPDAAPPRIVSCKGAIARHETGAIAGGCFVFRDCTQTVRLERQANAAEKRTAMGDLLSEVAHELNSPLDSTRRLLKLAQRSGIDPAIATDYLQDAMGAMDRMVEIVSKVLAFSRQDTGMQATPQPLTKVLDAYFHELTVTDRFPNVRIVRDYRGLGPVIPCTDFTAIVDNLVRNACDAMAYAGTIVLYGQRRDQEYILEIQDSGPGIPPELRERIFDPFFSTKPYGQGTGLGLALCRKILEPHGATLTCISEVGVGTTFRIVLPLTPPGESEPR